MLHRAHKSAHRLAAALLGVMFCTLSLHAQGSAQQKNANAAAAESGELTVDRIYGQPSLSGRLTRGIAWSLDGKKFSFFEMAGTGKEAKPALYLMDASTGQRSLLIAADKLESVLPAPSGKQSQATGLGRPPVASAVVGFG